MHNLIIGKRRAVAQLRISLIAAAFAGRFGVSEERVSALKVQEKDPIVKALKEQEAIADLLEEVAQKIGIPVQEAQSISVDIVASADSFPSEDLTTPADTGEGLPEPVIGDTDTKSAGKKKRQ